MTVVVAVCTVALGAGAVCAVVRAILGPTTLDRVVALDILVAVLVAAIGLEAVVSHSARMLPILVVLSLVGFVGSVSVSRFSAKDAS